jgi:arylformamidase
MVTVTHLSHLDRGDPATVSQLSMGAHTGTHVDAPCHFVRGGSGVDALDLQALVGPCLVVHTGDAGALSAGVLEALSIPSGTERLLFRTRNSDRDTHDGQAFDENYAALTKDAARWLAARGVRLVGIDALSIAPFEDTGPTHQILLEAGVIVLEGLDLGEVEAGHYQLVCLPLKIVGGDGSPARAVLIRGSLVGSDEGS